MIRERWNKDRFLREIESLSDKDEYIFSDFDDIKSCDSRFSIHCKKCGHIWQTIPDSFFGKKKSRCPICNVGVPWNKDRILKEIEKLEDKNAYIFSEYDNVVGVNSKIRVTCTRCEYIWYVSLKSFFKHNTRCPHCNVGEKWTNDRVKREFQLLDDSDKFILQLVGDIEHCYSKFSVTCKECSDVWLTTPDTFFNGGCRCFVCQRGERWTVERILKEFDVSEDKSNFSLILPEKIDNSQTKFQVRCSNGHIWETSASVYFYKKSRCPICCESRGEKRISLYLNNKQIRFEPQKKFDTCRNKKPLPFDFYLPDYNTIIEFNGKQHYEIGTRSKSYEKNLREFEQIKIRDAIKKQWAIENGYRFLEIRYDEINDIEAILRKELRYE